MIAWRAWRPAEPRGRRGGRSGRRAVAEPKKVVHTADGPERPDLAAELIRRREIDQKAHVSLIRGDRPSAAQVEWADAVVRHNTEWLETLVAEHGWPGFRLVGVEASHAARMLAQHADRRPELQRYWLTLLAVVVGSGDAEREDLAHLEDRVATYECRAQRHGAQRHAVDGGRFRLTPLTDGRINEYHTAAWSGYTW